MHRTASGPNKELLLVAVFITFNSVSYFLIQYDRMRTVSNTWVRTMLDGAATAPSQYRIGLALLARFLELSVHLRPNQSVPLIQFVSYAGALTLLYLLFRSSPRVENATQPRRFVLLGFFLAAVQFPVLWIFPWERWETLLIPFYLAAVVLLVVRRSRIPFGIVCVLTVLLAFGQALIRAEVPVAVGVAIVLSAAVAVPFPRPRSQTAILGVLCGLVGGGMQFYLQRVAYPNAAYAPNVPKIQLLANLNPFHPPIHIPIFVTALLPYIVSLALLRRHRIQIDSCDKLVLLICLVYLPFWITMGLIVEVRIFVPFLLLASPTIAKIWGSYLLEEATDRAT